MYLGFVTHLENLEKLKIWPVLKEKGIILLTNEDEPDKFDMPNDEDEDFVQSSASFLDTGSFFLLVDLQDLVVQ